MLIKKDKINYYIFWICIFFQNFAIIRTSSFGISALTIFMLYISLIKYKKIYLILKKTHILLFFSVVCVLIVGSLLNNILYITQILRNIMIVWLIYVVYIYVKSIYEERKEKIFWECFINVASIMFCYGYYEFLAIKNSWPLFLNVFNNNTSFAIRGVYDYYAGWTEQSRLYNVFYEPSAFSLFCVIMFFLVKEIPEVNNKKRYFLLFTILFNLLFSYSRTGWAAFIYMIAIYFCYYIFKNKFKLLDDFFIYLPIINILVMYSIGLFLFKDISSSGRTYSAIYYLKQSFENLKCFFVGHGCGTILNKDFDVLFVENSAHNGYCDLMYQYGIIFFSAFIIFLKKNINKLKEKKYLFIGLFTTMCCFETYYTVESIISCIVIVYVFCKNYNIKEVTRG